MTTFSGVLSEQDAAKVAEFCSNTDIELRVEQEEGKPTTVVMKRPTFAIAMRFELEHTS